MHYDRPTKIEIRIGANLKGRFQKACKVNGTTPSKAIRAMIEAYVQETPLNKEATHQGH